MQKLYDFEHSISNIKWWNFDKVILSLLLTFQITFFNSFTLPILQKEKFLSKVYKLLVHIFMKNIHSLLLFCYGDRTVVCRRWLANIIGHLITVEDEWIDQWSQSQMINHYLSIMNVIVGEFPMRITNELCWFSAASDQHWQMLITYLFYGASSEQLLISYIAG